ncbi:MAG: hypothetical protein BWY85_00175 [Firmicutes bacterium ADurb.Bin506]|nr:MAG: hypothetical protein BWY85_00175 [Firmicutes bacterium ADurb.Bin506]
MATSVQLDPMRRTIPGTDGLVSRMGTGRLGAEKYGAPGGSHVSGIYILSIEVVIAMARETGLSLEICERALHAFGRVSQNFVMSGKVVGIPYMGFLLPERRNTILRTAHLSKKVALKNRDMAAALKVKDGQIVQRNVVCFRTTRAMSRLFDDTCIPALPWKQYVRAERERILELHREMNPSAAISARNAERRKRAKLKKEARHAEQ